MAITETGLEERLEIVGDVLTSGDTERIGDLYTREGQLLPPGTEFVTGRTAVADFWVEAGEAGVDSIDIETIAVEEYGDAASRVGRATLADADGTALDNVKFIEIWKQEEDAWRIHRDIWNSNLPDEE